jgi:hypothetical protein
MKFEPMTAGSKQAGFKGSTGDCVVRAIAIALELPYREVYDAINAAAKSEKPRTSGKRSNSRTGVFKQTYRKWLEDRGWKFIATMGVGTGCKVHLRSDELPKGRLIVKVSRHLSAVIDGVIHDTHDPSRNGKRCVYGYYIKDNRR